MADDEDIPLDVQGYLSITGMPAYNPAYPPRANTGTRPRAAAAIAAPPPPSGWGAPESWDVIRRLSFNPFAAPPPAMVPVPEHPPPPPPSAAPRTPSPPPPPRTPSPAHLRPSASTRTHTHRTNVADVARQMAALQVLNRFASDREAADASDAIASAVSAHSIASAVSAHSIASAVSAHSIASAPDPVAAEEEATEAERAFHRELALSMLEGNTLGWPDGRPVTRDGGPLRMAGLVALTTGQPEEREQTWEEWSRENRWWMPIAWGGGGGDPNFTYFDHSHSVGSEPFCFAWGCWYCDCGPGCCNGGGRSARNRRAWTPGNLD